MGVGGGAESRRGSGGGIDFLRGPSGTAADFGSGLGAWDAVFIGAVRELS
jgi:hypothetical protein